MAIGKYLSVVPEQYRGARVGWFSLGFQFFDHFEHPPSLPAHPVDPPDLLGRGQALHEFFGLEFGQGTADVREVDLEFLRDLGRGLGGFEGEKDHPPVLPPDDVAAQLPHSLSVVT